MCHTDALFMITCGHVSFENFNCIDADCEPRRERIEMEGLCNGCEWNPSAMAPNPAHNLIIFRERSVREAEERLNRVRRARCIKETQQEHILASIPTEEMTDDEARAITDARITAGFRIVDREDGEEDDWNVGVRNAAMDDQNRIRMLGSALFTIPDHILSSGEW